MSEECVSGIIMAVGTSVGAIMTAAAGLILALANASRLRYNEKRVEALEEKNGKGGN